MKWWESAINNMPHISIPALAKEFGMTVKAMRLTLDKHSLGQIEKPQEILHLLAVCW